MPGSKCVASNCAVHSYPPHDMHRMHRTDLKVGSSLKVWPPKTDKGAAGVLVCNAFDLHGHKNSDFHILSTYFPYDSISVNQKHLKTSTICNMAEHLWSMHIYTYIIFKSLIFVYTLCICINIKKKNIYIYIHYWGSPVLLVALEAFTVQLRAR